MRELFGLVTGDDRLFSIVYTPGTSAMSATAKYLFKVKMLFCNLKMDFFIFSILYLVNATSYGCNDISLSSEGALLQSKCYMQAKGEINSKTLDGAVGCCLSKRIGNKRVFEVPFMQLRRLNTREQRIIRRERNSPFAKVAFIEEAPICYPQTKNHLQKFHIFLDELKPRRSRTTENRWDCFLTNDFNNESGENNFCRRVFNHLMNANQLKEMQKSVCDVSGRSIFPHLNFKNRTLRLGYISKLRHRQGLNHMN